MLLPRLAWSDFAPAPRHAGARFVEGDGANALACTLSTCLYRWERAASPQPTRGRRFDLSGRVVVLFDGARVSTRRRWLIGPVPVSLLSVRRMYVALWAEPSPNYCLAASAANAHWSITGKKINPERAASRLKALSSTRLRLAQRRLLLPAVAVERGAKTWTAVSPALFLPWMNRATTPAPRQR